MNSSECWSSACKLISDGKIEKAIELCESTSCSEALECQRFLGWEYYKRDNLETALSWFSRAAERDDAESLYGIATVNFVQRNFDVALQAYERAAKEGYSRAYHWMGYIHHQGLGVPRNVETATAYYKKGAAHGYLIADRALIHLAWQEGSLLSKLLAVPKYLLTLLKAAIAASQDVNDPRVADIPNAFKKR